MVGVHLVVWENPEVRKPAGFFFSRKCHERFVWVACKVSRLLVSFGICNIYAPVVGRYDSVMRVDVVNLLSNYFQLVSCIVSRPVRSRN